MFALVIVVPGVGSKSVCLAVLEVAKAAWGVPILVPHHRTRSPRLRMSWTYRSSFDDGSCYV